MKKNYFLLFLLLFTKLLFAQEPYTGEIRIFAGSYAPAGWAICNGSLLPISGYNNLYSIIGKTYGGNGTTTFALPDLQGRVPIGSGQAPGLSNYALGEKSGQESVTLTNSNMPIHAHNAAVLVNSQNTTAVLPSNNSSIATSGMYSGRSFIPFLTYTTAAPDVTLQTIITNTTGNSSQLELTPPRLVSNYIIALDAIFPQRK
ncbi:phage tail protein [Flavobacterium sp. FlaQc-28]|uniref:phage tail protein n=1 Tax=Flavobacterium sp. FlaQc-28 TaxID=3374178 RepID=UPI0037564318